MKLWLLRPVEGLPTDRNPWKPWYDKCFGQVVRAESEAQARAIADRNGDDENQEWRLENPRPWLAPELSTCVPLTGDGDAGTIIKDVWSA